MFDPAKVVKPRDYTPLEIAAKEWGWGSSTTGMEQQMKADMANQQMSAMVNNMGIANQAMGQKIFTSGAGSTLGSMTSYDLLQKQIKQLNEKGKHMFEITEIDNGFLLAYAPSPGATRRYIYFKTLSESGEAVTKAYACMMLEKK